MEMKLNEEQQKAFSHTFGPSMIFAGPGTGKTKLLTDKVAHLFQEDYVQKERILVFHYSLMASKVMRERIIDVLSKEESGESSKSLPHFATIQSFCVSVLREDIDKLGMSNNFVLYNEQQSFHIVRKILRRFPSVSARDILSQILRVKKSLKLPEDIQETYDKDFVSLYIEYQNILLDNQALDSEDVILLTYLLFKHCPKVLKKYQNLFEYILVDDYHNIEMAQYEILKMLSSEHRNICIAGDSDLSNSIHLESEENTFQRFQEDFPEFTRFTLKQNYRNTHNVLELSQRLIEKNIHRNEKVLWTSNEPGEKVHLHSFKKAQDEAEWVANTILALIPGEEGDRWILKEFLRDITILFRDHCVGDSIEEMLVQESIPYTRVQEKPFYKQKDIVKILSYLRFLYNEQDNESLLDIFNYPERDIEAQTIETFKRMMQEKGKTVFSLLETIDMLPFDASKKDSLMRFLKLLKRWKGVVKSITVDELIKKVVQESGMNASYYNGSSQQKALNHLLQFSSPFVEHKEHGLELFLDEIHVLSQQDIIQTQDDSVLLAPIDAVKGLEYKTVFIVGLENGILPRKIEDHESKELCMEGERRLLYTAMTRTRERLYMSYVKERLLFSQHQPMQKSSFISELSKEFLELHQVAKKSKKTKKLDPTEDQMVLPFDSSQAPRSG